MQPKPGIRIFKNLVRDTDQSFSDWLLDQEGPNEIIHKLIQPYNNNSDSKSE